MTDGSPKDQSAAEIAYYKRRLREVAADNLKREFQLNEAMTQLRQKRQGFALLSLLASTIGSIKDVAEVFDVVLRELNARVGMDRSVALMPIGTGEAYRPVRWQGYSEQDAERLAGQVVALDAGYTRAEAPLLVNGSTPVSPMIARLREAFGVPYFICAPVAVDGLSVGVLLAGRLHERGPQDRASSLTAMVSPPLDDGDADTFHSIAGLIASNVKNMRIGMLEELDRLKTAFFANISHEFRTPITLTLGPIEGMLAERYGAITPAIREQCELVVRNQRRLLGLINQLLDLAKLEAGKMQLAATRMVDFNGFVRTNVAVFQEIARQRGIELQSTLDPACDAAAIYIDREKMEVVLHNLLSNAHKFTQRGVIEVTTRVVGGALSLEVRDSGVGIREQDLPYIFNRFQQASGSVSREFAGTGIGLSLVKELVELHAGRVDVESWYGRGTTFTITLPLGRDHLPDGAVVARPDTSPTDAPRPLPVAIPEVALEVESTAVWNTKMASAARPDRPTILYVDDNPELRTHVRDLLAPHYNVYLAADGQDGLEVAQRVDPDVVLSDLMMPRMRGDELCRTLRALPSFAGTPFVLLTAKSSTQSRIAGLDLGADDYLGKPFSAMELLARLRNLVIQRAQHRQIRRDLHAAREIQLAMLPARSASFGRVTVEALYRASDALSGDYFDFAQAGATLYVLLADVTSHGTASAQVTYLVRELFHRSVAEARSLVEVVRRMRSGYAARQLALDVGFALVRVATDTGAVELIRANTPAPCVVAAGEPRAIAAAPGAPLSKDVEGTIGERAELRLAPGERLFLFTDGALALRATGQPFGRRQLASLLAKLPASGWSERLIDELTRLNGGPQFEDDLTVLRLEVS